MRRPTGTRSGSTGFQPSLFGHDPDPRPGSFDGLEHIDLGRGAWVDRAFGWMHGADRLFEELLESVPWRADRRRMYEREVAVPRLVAFYQGHQALPAAALDEGRTSLGRHYARERLGPFETTGLCLYRDGRDSVAWHGDRIGQGGADRTLVAIVSLGEPRRVLLRPSGGGRSVSFCPGHGDLLVMGGTCQRTWEHCVPKSGRPVGPRLSVQYRVAGVG